MGVYANGHLIYGFVHDDITADLFTSITDASESEDEEEEGIHQDLQEKHSISLFSVGYGSVDILSAFSANASAKNFDDQELKTEDLARTEEYDRHIADFLRELGIDPTSHTPRWHILSYMD